MKRPWKLLALALLLGAGLFLLVWLLLNPPKPRPRPPEPDSIGGVVWCDANANGFTDSSEVGVADITIKLTDGSGATVVATTEPASGGYEGAFLFRNLKVGTYSLQVDESTLPAELSTRTEPASWPLSPALGSPGASVTDVNAGYEPADGGCP